MEVKKKQVEAEVSSPLHNHPLVPFTRFDLSWCKGCYSPYEGIHIEISDEQPDYSYIYGGYRCNEPECERAVFHKACVEPLPEINHSSHPDHPLKLLIIQDRGIPRCSLCREGFKVGYWCSKCNFKLDLACSLRRDPFIIPENSYVHEHPLKLSCYEKFFDHKCKACGFPLICSKKNYVCRLCEFAIHADCVDAGPEAYHASHPQHPLKSIRCQVPDYADKKCLLCDKEFDRRHYQLQHCDVCNFSICRRCMKNPPPISVECLTTHEHQLHLVPRRMEFTCNACGTQGDRSPYFCLPCNFMIHRECIGLPRVININRHDHRISYTPRLGHGEWKCKVCRQKVDGFYGAYFCSKCPTFAVHSRCATRRDVWDMVEREGTPEEEIVAPFEVLDGGNTIKHFSHDHNLRFNEDGMALAESTVCVACVFQICSEPFYRCEECDFILHENCANLPRKKRHVSYSRPFTLRTGYKVACCSFCFQPSTGFRYEVGDMTLDVRCASISDSLEHESHPHPLYYYYTSKATSKAKRCSRCGDESVYIFSCDECDYILDGQCALLPKKVMRNRYDDHPLFLSYGDMNVDEKYWCEACETKVNPKKGFYTCNHCGIVLHISCVVGGFSYITPGTSVTSCLGNPGKAEQEYAFFLPPMEVEDFEVLSVASSGKVVEEVVSNTSICRKSCSVCNSRCKAPSILKFTRAGVDLYICSLECLLSFKKIGKASHFNL